MTCMEARAALLDADVAELRGGAGTELCAHIASCDECARLASAMLAEMDVLDHALTTLSSERNAEMPTSHTNVIPITRNVAVHTAHRARRAFAAAAVIACVAIGAAMFEREIGRRAGDAYPLYLPPLPVAAGPVNASAGGAVAVIRTSNPKITVVWYLATQRGKS